MVLALGTIVGVTSVTEIRAAQLECEDCSSRVITCFDYREADPEFFTSNVAEACDGMPDWFEILVHHFVLENQECQGSNPPSYCRACRGTSSCHVEWDTGGCHAPCGEEFLALSVGIDRALAERDAGGLIALLADQSIFVFDSEIGRIRIEDDAPCTIRWIERKVIMDPANWTRSGVVLDSRVATEIEEWQQRQR